MIAWRLVRIVFCLSALLLVLPARAASPAVARTIAIDAPATAPVGAPIAIGIDVDAADGSAVELVAIGSYGPRLYAAPVENGVARITIPAADTERAGHLSLVATAGASRRVAAIELLPDQAVTPIVPTIGTRTIVADGSDASMAIVIPRDRWGNPVRDGTAIALRSRQPDGTQRDQTLRIDHLLAWTRLRSGTDAGRTLVTVADQQPDPPAAVLIEFPDWPTGLTLTATPPRAPADGRANVSLRTGVIRDRFGNVVPDGTLVSFVLEGAPRPQRDITAFTIDGVAEAVLRAPRRPQRVAVRAVVRYIASAPTRVVWTEPDRATP